MSFDDYDPDIDFEPELERPPKPQIDPVKLQHYIDLRRTGQHLPFATLAGFVGALIGAAIWLGLTVSVNTQIGWMAVGVGFIVGLMVRHTGHGIDRVFGIMGAVTSLVGCGLGTVLAGCWLLAGESEEVIFADLVLSLTPGLVTEILKAMLSPANLVFYGIAAITGYWVSIQRIGREERALLMEDAVPGQTA